MITLKDWMECVNYRITEGSEYCWNCYGYEAYSLDSWDKDQDGVSASIVFDTENQTVFQVEVHDYTGERSYRYINPEYRDAHRAECKDRGVDDEAYDGVRFIDLEDPEDFLAKCRAIMNYEEYDDRVSIPLDIPEDELMVLFKAAHERDMTFNEFVEQAIRAALAEFERDPEGMTERAKEFVNGKSLA